MTIYNTCSLRNSSERGLPRIWSGFLRHFVEIFTCEGPWYSGFLWFVSKTPFRHPPDVFIIKGVITPNVAKHWIFFTYAFVLSQCRLELRVTPMAYLPPTLYGEERAVRNILECFLVRRIKHVHVGFAKWNEGGDTAKDRSMFATRGYTQIYRLICGPLHHSYYQQITKPLDDLTQIYTSTHQASLIRATLYMGIMRNAHITFGVGWLGSRESSCAYLYKARCP